jgi:primosomal protein N' (replication factor Y)
LYDARDVVQRGGGGAVLAGLGILGPAPAPLGRLRGEYRTQVLLKGTNRKKMREALMSAIASRPDLERRIVVDVDPVSVL